MSTIKSSDEHLTLNADGSSKDIKFQANGVEKASISSAGAFTSTTIDATKLTGDLPAISGANLTGVGVAGITSSADATAMTITSGEDVGIGQTNPQQTLHVTGQTRLSGTGVLNDHNMHNDTVLEVRGTHMGAGTVDTDAVKLFKLALNDNTEYGGQAQFALGRWAESGAEARTSMVISLGNGNQNSQSNADTDVLELRSDGRGISQFTARGWVHFNGAGTLSIADSHNVSSVTDSSNGHYEINWSNNMANTNYSVACTSGHQETGGQTDSYTATSFRHQGILTNKVEIQCIRLKFNEQQMADPYIVCLVAFGD